VAERGSAEYAEPRLTGPRIALIAVLASAIGLTAAWAQVPPSLQPGPGGVRAELSLPDAEGGIWRLQAYRPRRPAGSMNPSRGELDLCLALDKGGRRSYGMVCDITASIALGIDRAGLWTFCGGRPIVVGEPARPRPTCGLVAPEVQGVTVTAAGHPPQAATLSEPFQIRVNQSARVLKKAGLDVERIRALPPVLTTRAYLAFVDTPPTQPGKRTPRVTVTGTWPDGASRSLSFAGSLVPRGDRVRLSVRGPDGRVWRTISSLGSSAEVCTDVWLGSKGIGTGCSDWRGLGGRLAREGSEAFTHSGPRPRAGYAVHGLAHESAVAVEVTDWRGRSGRARLSRWWTSVPRARGGPMRIRSFLAVLPGKGPVWGPPLSDWVEVRTTLDDGRVLKTRLRS
jgi:hypothetical protein